MDELTIGITITVIGGLILKLVTSENFSQKMKSILARKKIKLKKLLIYISEGGTCRDPMAVAITKKILEEKKINIDLKIEGMALGPTSNSETSFAARKAIEQLFGQDLLRNHKPKRINKEDMEKADLILVMDKKLINKKILPQNKTYLLKEFFNDQGDVVDPWPDGRDEATLSRYLETAKELNNIISSNIDKLITVIK